MKDVLENYYGGLFVMRAPAPVNVNKAGANYKSEVAHTVYSPRRAYEEWLSICEAILEFGGDALIDFESDDEPFLDHEELRVSADGSIHDAAGGKVLGHLDDVQTGRVFCANGPWVIMRDGMLTALMPHMLPHRLGELSYYERMLEAIADTSGLALATQRNPHRWEGLADVAIVGNHVVLTYAVPGHYDAEVGPKTTRSSREGAEFAAHFAALTSEATVYAELVYPHFHGDTVLFGLTPAQGDAKLVFYAGGLYQGERERVVRAIGSDRILNVASEDAVTHYAANSRQVLGGVLVPHDVSRTFEDMLRTQGLGVRRVPLGELFGKAGGGPGCATLYLPRNLAVPRDFPQRYSVQRARAQARTTRLAREVQVDPAYFSGRVRG